MGISILLPSIGREKRLKQLLHDITQEATDVGAEIVLVFDESERGPYDDLEDIYTVFYTETVGYWRCLNIAMYIAKHEIILWTADDIKPHPGWLKTGINRFHSLYPNGLGMVCLNDLLVYDLTCGHAITTKRFMGVLFEDGKFPDDIEHLYMDTMVCNRAKEIGRYHFCAESVTEHIHYLSGKIEQDDTSRKNEARARANKDKLMKDAHDQRWYNGGMNEALNRLKILEAE